MSTRYLKRIRRESTRRLEKHKRQKCFDATRNIPTTVSKSKNSASIGYVGDAACNIASLQMRNDKDIAAIAQQRMHYICSWDQEVQIQGLRQIRQLIIEQAYLKEFIKIGLFKRLILILEGRMDATIQYEAILLLSSLMWCNGSLLPQVSKAHIMPLLIKYLEAPNAFNADILWIINMLVKSSVQFGEEFVECGGVSVLIKAAVATTNNVELIITSGIFLCISQYNIPIPTDVMCYTLLSLIRVLIFHRSEVIAANISWALYYFIKYNKEVLLNVTRYHEKYYMIMDLSNLLEHNNLSVKLAILSCIGLIFQSTAYDIKFLFNFGILSKFAVLLSKADISIQRKVAEALMPLPENGSDIIQYMYEFDLFQIIVHKLKSEHLDIRMYVLRTIAGIISYSDDMQFQRLTETAIVSNLCEILKKLEQESLKIIVTSLQCYLLKLYTLNKPKFVIVLQLIYDSDVLPILVHLQASDDEEMRTCANKICEYFGKGIIQHNMQLNIQQLMPRFAYNHNIEDTNDSGIHSNGSVVDIPEMEADWYE